MSEKSIRDLEKRIKKVRNKNKSQKDDDGAAQNPMKVSLDIVAGIAVGSVMGLYLDKWFNTSPVFFIICFFLGVAASALNIYKLVQKNEHSENK